MEPRGCERHRWATRTGELSGESESMEPRGCERHRWATRTGELSGESESILPLAAISKRWHRKSICSSEHKKQFTIERVWPALAVYATEPSFPCGPAGSRRHQGRMLP